ncbi:UNVERIFIED_CONTAM: hypothetical protein Sangu_2844600 [Sesamum angustifolium]|uniref:Copia protein n=1 Tax=Sesamum angustifolium TaxID=2727405 RepID=A0AAW2IQQ5_9LAMI
MRSTLDGCTTHCPLLKRFSYAWAIFPSSSNFELTAYCDVDWASCSDSRHSLTVFCVFMGGALVSWKTKKQSTVSHSTAKAEYGSMPLRFVSSDGYRMFFVILEFQFLFLSKCFANQAALHIMANPMFHERTKHIKIDCHVVRDAYKENFVAERMKHIEIDCHVVRDAYKENFFAERMKHIEIDCNVVCDAYKENFVAPSYVWSSLLLADLFTKILPLKFFSDLMSKLGLFSMVPSPTCGWAVEIGDTSATIAAAAMPTDLELEVEDDEVLDAG